MKDRFSVIYHLFGDEADCRARAADICLEQTVELGEHLVPNGFIKDEILGRIEDFNSIGPDQYETRISYLTETTALELTQFLNLVFGNISIKKGIRLHDVLPSDALLRIFKGPRFGIEGLRKQLNVKDKPLLCSALKPMGLSPDCLAGLAYQFALGGVDLIKDDHGLSNQAFCPFKDRVKACVAAVEKANSRTGNTGVYIPNITAPASRILERAYTAKELGAGGVMLLPGLSGFDAMKTLSMDDDFNLPILSHPSFLGSMVLSEENGLSHGFLFGKLQRLAGADASIYPNYGGRFGFSKSQCEEINANCKHKIGHVKPIFPMPGGGMSMDRVDGMRKVYGNDVLFLVGGGLMDYSRDIVHNVRHFLSIIGRN